MQANQLFLKRSGNPLGGAGAQSSADKCDGQDELGCYQVSHFILFSLWTMAGGIFASKWICGLENEWFRVEIKESLVIAIWLRSSSSNMFIPNFVGKKFVVSNLLFFSLFLFRSVCITIGSLSPVPANVGRTIFSINIQNENRIIQIYS